MLQRAGAGCGALALSTLLHADRLFAAPAIHPPAKAKSVIWLFMNGGPSGLDLFDYKPMLDKMHGQPFPGAIKTLFPHPGPILKPVFKFDRYGECGAHVARPYSNLAEHVDDITFLKACHSTELNHGPACYLMNSGSNQIGAASLGSWVNYGLGSVNENLPGFVVMYDSCCAPEGGANLWNSGFLPSSTQAVAFQPKGEPVLYLDRPQGVTDRQQQQQLQLMERLNAQHLQAGGWDPGMADELEARIQSFETAYRMQMAVPDAIDVQRESEATHRLYGLDRPHTREFGRQLLMARRMVERGVRFIQVYHGGSTNNWDDHGGLAESHGELCHKSDVPIAGLLADLKQRGLFDETLVVWGGEFGRLPISQDVDGRDHNPYGFTMFLAGGGTKRGYTHGSLDEFGYRPIEGAVSMHDLHATILHLMGINHHELTYFFNGRDQSLTNRLGEVVHDVIA